MRIQFVYDFICPWCYIGLHRLKKVMEAFPEQKFDIEFVAYPLADLPRESVIYRDRLIEMFDGDVAQVEKNAARIAGIGRELGLNFRYDRQLWIGSTFDAHRMVKYAPESKQLALVDAVFRAQFEEGRKISAVDDLAAIAAEAGVGSVTDCKRFAASDELAPVVREELTRSEGLPLITVPYLVIDGTYQVQAAHLPDVTMSCVSNLQ